MTIQGDAQAKFGTEPDGAKFELGVPCGMHVTPTTRVSSSTQSGTKCPALGLCIATPTSRTCAMIPATSSSGCSSSAVSAPRPILSMRKLATSTVSGARTIPTQCAGRPWARPSLSRTSCAGVQGGAFTRKAVKEGTYQSWDEGRPPGHARCRPFLKSISCSSLGSFPE